MSIHETGPEFGNVARGPVNVTTGSDRRARDENCNFCAMLVQGRFPGSRVGMRLGHRPSGAESSLAAEEPADLGGRIFRLKTRRWVLERSNRDEKREERKGKDVTLDIGVVYAGLSDKTQEQIWTLANVT